MDYVTSVGGYYCLRFLAMVWSALLLFATLHGVCVLIVASYRPYLMSALCARFTSSLQSSVLCLYKDELAPFSLSSQILTEGRTRTVLVN